MNKKNYKCKKPNSRHAIDSVKNSIIYSPEYFGFKKIKGNGFGVNVCIIDTGLPSNKYLPSITKRSIDFTNSSVLDKHGHSTGVSGIINSQAKGNVIGIAPKSSLWHAKAIGDNGSGEHGAVQASILYAIVQNVDIIVMSFGCDSMHPFLHDAIKKAYNNGICMFAAAGNNKSHTRDANFPARLKEVMSVGLCDNKKIQTGKIEAPSIDMPLDSIYTTYLNDKFIKMGGSSVAAPVVAGAAACIIQQERIAGNTIKPVDVYKKLMESTKN